MYPPSNVKNSLCTCWFSGLHHCQTSQRNQHSLPLHPHCSLLGTLQSGFTQPCSETVLSGLPVTELDIFFFFSFCILYPSLSLTFIPFSNISQTVSPPLKMSSSAIAVSIVISLLFKIHLQECALSDSVFRVLQTLILIGGSVLSQCPILRIWSKILDLHFQLLI